MNYFYNAPPRAYATTTVDFRNPSAANIQQVLKESWPTFALVGALGLILGFTNLIPWGLGPTAHYIVGFASLAAAGYGYMLNKQ